MQGNAEFVLIFILYCLHIVLCSRALSRSTHSFEFSSRHLSYSVVDSELDGRAVWNSDFLVSITWLNTCNCKKNTQFGHRYAVLYLKCCFQQSIYFSLLIIYIAPSFIFKFLVWLFLVFSEHFFLLKTSLKSFPGFFNLQSSSKTFKPSGTFMERTRGRGVQDTRVAHGLHYKEMEIHQFMVLKWTFAIVGKCCKFWSTWSL